MTVRNLKNCVSGATAAEFALVLPLQLLFIFGLVDVGRVMWTLNRAEKATQMGARFAVATEILPQGLDSYSFVTDGGLSQGVIIPESHFGGATCTSAGCTCKAGATCPPLGTFDSAAFTNIVDRMQAALPEIQAANVRIDYDYAGLGYAGDPNGVDVAPLVTVRLVGLSFQPLTFILFGGSISLPDFRAALTLEDGVGGISN